MNWACGEHTDGYANAYELSLNGLTVLNLGDSEYTILDWLALLVANRDMQITTPLMAEAFDYTANACGISVDGFANAFLASGCAAAWEAGSPKVLCGRSGTELAQDCLSAVGVDRSWPPPRVDPLGRTPEYWAGWVLAYAQHKTARPFADYVAVLPPHEIVAMYHPLHEASEDTFVDRSEEMILRRQRNALLLVKALDIQTP